VVILAGGEGTRIRHLWPDIPKALIPVNGRPFIEHQLNLLASHGFRRVLICTGYGADRVEDFVGDGSRWGMKVTYSREAEDRLLGTGGALVNALGRLEERFMVLYGDAYLPIDYARAVAAYQAQPLPAMMCVFRNRGRWDRSNAAVRDGRVVRYDKKSPDADFEYIDYGVNFFARSIIERYALRPLPLDLAVIQSDLAAAGELAAYEVHTRFYEIGSPEGLRDLERFLAGGTTGG